MTSRGVFIAESRSRLTLLNASLKNFKNIAHCKDSYFFQVLANNASLNIFT